MDTVKQVLGRVISVLFPMRCVLCGDVVEHDDLRCGKCGTPRACEIAPGGESGLDGAVSPLFYEGNARNAVLKLKRKPDERTARFFAELMSGKVKAELGGDFDMLVPIPISLGKLSERGFNQAETLARELGGIMGIKVVSGILSRNDLTAAQHRLTARERTENAKRSYSVRNAEPVKGRKILLVDDIYTTGATVRTCASLLKSAGAVGVWAVTATYTEPRRRDY